MLGRSEKLSKPIKRAERGAPAEALDRMPDLQARFHRINGYGARPRVRTLGALSEPEVDSGRLTALANFAAALSDSGDNATARPLFEELVVLKQKGHKGRPYALCQYGAWANGSRLALYIELDIKGNVR
eukprot:COSAG06_NODE_12264_length_1402_cov_1.653108_1_plen_129_part_00